MAVLPVPGSPIRTGLFLVRRDSTWMTRRTSSSRPITGSSVPRSAASVRSRPYCSRAWYLSSGFGSVTRAEPRTGPQGGHQPVARDAAAGERLAGGRGLLERPSRMCSVEMYSSSSASASVPARRSTAAVRVRELGAGGRAAHLGAAADGRLDGGPQAGQVGAGALEHRLDDALAGLEQRGQQVIGLDDRVAPLAGDARRCGDRLLRAFGGLVNGHQ